MTAVRHFTLSEAGQRWAESQRRWEATSDHDRKQHRDQWVRCGNEGHLPLFLHVVEDAHAGEIWSVHCAGCKDNPWGMTSDEMMTFATLDGWGGSSKPGPFLLNFAQARQWASDHLREHGVSEPETYPAFYLYDAERMIHEQN